MGRRGATWLVVAALAAAGPLAGQEVHRVPAGDVAIYNLAGAARVVAGQGPDVVVRLLRGGGDAGRLEVEVGEVDGRETLRVIYPSDRIVYPGMGRGSMTQVSVDGDGTFGDGNEGWRRDRVRVAGSGDGLEAWADLEIEVPPGGDFALYLAVGEADVEGVEGDVIVDTGSGRVAARDIRGSLLVDTGSGSIVVAGVDGSVEVDTGSGSVEVDDVRGESVLVDTGSGSVRGSGIQSRSLHVDTGSGGIELARVAAADVVLDTGSGRIEVDLLEDVERLDVDTGSGSVTVRVPTTVGAEVEVDTGSGGIDLDVPVEVRSVRRNYLLGSLGDGRGSIRIDTGSGSVSIIGG